MTQAFEPVTSVAGTISGRDAIFLDDVQMDYRDNSIVLRGELNAVLCSKLKDDSSFVRYEMVFTGVLAFVMNELDFRSDWRVSSFDRVINSEWLREIRSKDQSHKVKPNHEHYVVSTYDDVFDIVCESYDLRLGDP